MKTKVISSLFGSSLLVVLFASGASGQAQRTFVSGLGNDGNPCSRTSPCRTFGQAIMGTNAGGEVIVLDAAGYGPFAITKSISSNGLVVENGAKVTVRSSLASNNTNGFKADSFNSAPVELNIESCVASNNSGAGTEPCYRRAARVRV